MDANIDIYAAQCEVRLLHLAPTDDDDEPIVCELFPVTLAADPAPGYEAISYCWSEYSGRRLLVINGVQTDAPASAVRVLSRFRFSDKPRVLWIDAICINQQDIDERSSQVAMLGDIYSKTQRTLVWLGDADETADAFVNTMDLVTEDIAADEHNYSRVMQTWRSSGDKLQDATLPLPKGCNEAAVNRFFSRRWFRRVWVVQEVMLSPSAVCVWGQSQVPWENIPHLALWLIYKMAITEWHIAGDAVTGMMTAVMTLADGTDAVLSGLLMQTRTLGATEARDKVYGVMGIHERCKWRRDGFVFPIDYRMPLSEICARATHEGMREVGHLDALKVSHQPPSQSKGDHDVKWPSWVPRWNEQPALEAGDTAQLHNRYGRCDAGRNVVGVFGHYDTATGPAYVLRLDGIATDALSTVDEKVVRSADRAETVDFFQHSYALFEQEVRHGHNDDRPSAVLEVITSASVFSRDLAIEDDTKLQLTSMLEKGRMTYTAEVKLILLDILNTCRNRRTFLTAAGRFGIGPQNARSGDIVAVLFGADVPYIVRPYQDPDEIQEQSQRDETEPQQYEMIGQCYVLGIMTGEVVRNHEADGLPMVTFELV